MKLTIHKRALISRALRGEFGFPVSRSVGNAAMQGEAMHSRDDAQSRDYWGAVHAWSRIVNLREAGHAIH